MMTVELRDGGLIEFIRRRALAALIPPPRLQLSQ